MGQCPRGRRSAPPGRLPVGRHASAPSPENRPIDAFSLTDPRTSDSSRGPYAGIRSVAGVVASGGDLWRHSSARAEARGRTAAVTPCLARRVEGVSVRSSPPLRCRRFRCSTEFRIAIRIPKTGTHFVAIGQEGASGMERSPRLSMILASLATWKQLQIMSPGRFVTEFSPSISGEITPPVPCRHDAT